MKKVIITSDFSLKNNRKLKVFFIFLILTSIIWLLLELSKSYTSSVAFNVEYQNVPDDKLLQSAPDSELNIVVNSPGFTLLKYKISKPKIILNLSNLVQKNDQFYLLPNSQISSMNTQISGETSVVRVLKDTIFLELGKNISKKVPVVPNLDIKFKLGYNFVEEVDVIPDSIIITGAEKYVDSIRDIKTDLLKLSEVYESIEANLLLEIPFEKNQLKLSVYEVELIGRVDKFTEGTFKLPVVIINEPEGIEINPFPKEIEVVYQVALSNFNLINENSFNIVFDYNEFANDTLIHHLAPKILQQSKYIHSLKIIPNQIEFLIQK